MKLFSAHRHMDAQHGIVCSFPDDFFGYLGWPTVARTDDGTLVVAASGFRNAHVCPFGRTVICVSADQGRTWTSPAVVNDSPMDDRDAGILSLGGCRLLLSWFSTDTRCADVYERYRTAGDEEFVRRYTAGFARMADQTASRWVGSWVRVSDDGGETWERPVRVPVTAPHGPIRLRDGSLLYLGKEFITKDDVAKQRRRLTNTGRIMAIKGTATVKSADDGLAWEPWGVVPLHPGTVEAHYHEPHAVELPDGKLLGLIRLEDAAGPVRLKDLGLAHFSLMQTESADGGRTWTTAQPLGFHGSPPHVMGHSSGALVCVYGHRLSPFGQRAMISDDGGETWTYGTILRDDGPDGDLGYPSSVELDDGSILTVYYQKLRSKDEKCSLLWSRWRLPG